MAKIPNLDTFIGAMCRPVWRKPHFWTAELNAIPAWLRCLPVKSLMT